MSKFEEAYAQLNAAQKRAVDQVEGPVLVIAGPGTGKTQLLAVRIANILAKTDVSAANILCLTFTDSAAQTMRERLAQFIGQDAYEVTISTYHAFGSDLIRRFPDYFAEMSELQPIDELGIDTTLRAIIQQLPYDNPLKFADLYLGDIKTLISDAKRALLTPADLRTIAAQNQAFVLQASPVVGEHLSGVTRIDKKSIPVFEALLKKFAIPPSAMTMPGNIMPLGEILAEDLQKALDEVGELNKTTPLTKWKNKWLAKDEQGAFVVDGHRTAQKLAAAAEIYQTYLDELAARGLYDYDDMILRAVQALQTHADLRYTLQEQYLYLLLDEFQDTNGAQLKLVELLTDNPVNEDRPNVLAVGDDDQAIYAFQGANYSHMLAFGQLYRDVLVVPLTQNYRSHQDILNFAQGVAAQIDERLHRSPELEKTLVSAKKKLPARAVVERHEARSDAGQFGWVTGQIQKLLKSGIPASEIAVLAPKHKYLEPLVPFLQNAGIPVRYEKRENVLDDPAITQLLRMSELCLALARGEQAAANSLWAEVLSFEFWQLPTRIIWQLSWQAFDDDRDWTTELLEQPELQGVALFFIQLGQMSRSETLETMLDYLIGRQPLELREPGLDSFQSPFFAYYFSSAVSPPLNNLKSRAGFWDLLNNLIVLRARLRDYRRDELKPLSLTDLLEFVAAYRAANLKLVNASPYQEAAEAVQLLTAFKAKGQEYEAVFLLAVSDEAWGGGARGQGSRLGLPPNLQFIRYAGATDDERLRLLYVACTRAKSQLFLANYTSTYAGKVLARLKYLNESVGERGEVVSPLLPAGHQTVLPVEREAAAISTNELGSYWQQRHAKALSKRDVANLLRARLEQFQLSPTHLNDFTDIVDCGPEAFFLKTILRFPQAPSPQMQFGNAMHEALEWVHRFHKQEGQLPSQQLLNKTFEKRLRGKRLPEPAVALLLARGQASLRAWLVQRGETVSADDDCEYNFRGEGVFVGKVHVSGKVDKLVIDKTKKTITIVDFKTGRAHTRWERAIKLHKYRQQLYFYKLLVECSPRFADYRVVGGRVEFVEPDEQGRILLLPLDFDDAEQRALTDLIQVVWQRIKKLELPDTSGYKLDLAGIEAFERDLLGTTALDELKLRTQQPR